MQVTALEAFVAIVGPVAVIIGAAWALSTRINTKADRADLEKLGGKVSADLEKLAGRLEGEMKEQRGKFDRQWDRLWERMRTIDSAVAVTQRDVTMRYRMPTLPVNDKKTEEED